MSTVVASIAVTSALLAATSTGQAQVQQTVEQEGALRYLQYLPKSHDPQYRWPVLVFLHGGGEIGTDITKLLGHSLPALVEQDGWDWPFIVVSPQLDSGKWFERSADIGILLDRVAADHGGDPNRTYLTGLSWGGIGTFDVGILLADRWAALMPLCSNAANGAPWEQRQKLVGKPLFVVHGTADAGVPFQGDVDRVTQLEALGATFFDFDYALSDTDKDAIPRAVLEQDQVFGRFVDFDHGVWNPVYGRVGGVKKTVQYEWLLSRSLDGTPYIDPKLAPPGNPNAGGTGGTGGTGGSAGSAGSAAMLAAGGLATSSSGAPQGTTPDPGPQQPPLTTSPAAASGDSGSGCQLSMGSRPGLQGLGALASLWLLGRRQRRRVSR